LASAGAGAEGRRLDAGTDAAAVRAVPASARSPRVAALPRPFAFGFDGFLLCRLAMRTLDH
jgi:hypothetical protein